MFLFSFIYFFALFIRKTKPRNFYFCSSRVAFLSSFPVSPSVPFVLFCENKNSSNMSRSISIYIWQNLAEQIEWDWLLLMGVTGQSTNGSRTNWYLSENKKKQSRNSIYSWTLKHFFLKVITNTIFFHTSKDTGIVIVF